MTVWNEWATDYVRKQTIKNRTTATMAIPTPEMARKIWNESGDFRKVEPPKRSGFLRCETCNDVDWMMIVTSVGELWGMICTSCNAGYRVTTEPGALNGMSVSGLGEKIFTEPKE